MRFRLSLLIMVSFIASSAQIGAQQVAQLLRSSLTAQAGQATVQDVTVNGSVESISGADDETIPATFRAVSSGSARSDVSLSAGTLTEIRQNAASGTTGVWLKSNGKHTMAGHNTMTDAAWFFPLFIVQRLLSDQNASVLYVGVEGTTIHLRAFENASLNLPATAAQQIQHFTQIDLYLDASSSSCGPAIQHPSRQQCSH